VGVDVVDFEVHAVAEASGLGDVGDAVLDHPGFVGVAQAVEGEGGVDLGADLMRVVAIKLLV